MKQRGLKRLIGVVAICGLAGAIAGIAGSAAAPSKSSRARPAFAARGFDSAFRRPGFRARFRPGFKRTFGPAFLGAPGGPPVHAEMVVPNQNGDGFDTVTMDNGKLKSIDGSKLTITEGTDKKTYGEPTIDVGSDPTVIRNHQKAALGDLQTGDFVHVIQGPKGVLVIAEDPAFRKKEQSERPHWDGRPGEPPPPPFGGP